MINQLDEEYKDRAILVGMDFEDGTNMTSFMEELSQLVKACDMETVEWMLQKSSQSNKATFIGTGKVMELKDEIALTNATIVIFAQSLTPSQLRNLSDTLHIPVMDRTSLILEIFSKRAKTREAKLQVEVARLQYTLPRLVGLHSALSRQGGASGSLSNKGLGEKKLELDKRRLEQRLHELKIELEKVEENRMTQRKKRNNDGIYSVALVGYTNAGKSTLMNAFLDAYAAENGINTQEKKVFEKDMLFATLDTTVRRIYPNEGVPFLLTDTVGFVSNLPHGLVKAFRSTLEETKNADLLLHVVDSSDVNHEEQLEITKQVLKELGADEIPALYVYNKADICFDSQKLPQVVGNKIYISAKQKIGIDLLQSYIQKALSSQYVCCTLMLPYKDGNIYSYLKKNAILQKEEYLEDGIKIEGKLPIKDYEKFIEYVKK